MKNILKQLESANKPICVELTDEASGKRFLAEAERAGFRFEDGAKPTERACGRVMVLKNDRTICYAGAYGTMAFGCNDDGRIRLRYPLDQTSFLASRNRQNASVPTNHK